MKTLRPGGGRPNCTEMSVVFTPGAAKAANLPCMVGPFACVAPASSRPTPGGDIHVTSALGGGA